MKITVQFMGTPCIDGIENGDAVTVNPGTTLADFLRDQQLEPAAQMFVVQFINGEPQEPAYELQDGDELTLYLPVSGG